MRRRRLVVLAVVAAVVVSAAAGWGAASTIRSPAQLAARTAPPPPSLITVPVELRTITSDVVVRGTVRLGEPRAVTLAGTPGGVDAAAAVVTRAPEEGAEVTECTAALEVSGRPVVVLGGDLPTYRDLRPGALGADVAQLEAALARCGHDPGTADDRYDGGTEAAVERLYAALGYEASGPTEDEETQLEAAEEELRVAAVALRAAERAAGGGRADALEAEAAVRAAQDAVATATATAEAQNGAATRAAAQAAAALQAAEHQAASLRAQAAAPEDIAAADAAVVAAVGARDDAVAAERLARAEGAAAVRQAHDQVAVSQARRTELEDGGEAADALVDARANEQRARERLAELDAEIGVTVPAAEVVVLPGLPLRVSAVAAGRGADATGELMTVTSAGLTVDSSLTREERELVSVGDAVQISDSVLGIEVAGTVAAVADQPGTGELDERAYALQVTLPDAPPELRDASVRLTIPVRSTDGDVLAVPPAALTAAADGSSRVEVATGEGDETRTLAVLPGLSAQGFVEVRPEGGALAAGDRVVVGR